MMPAGDSSEYFDILCANDLTWVYIATWRIGVTARECDGSWLSRHVQSGHRVTVPALRLSERGPGFAFGSAIPIALLGGLIGLGGAEFRLPVLVEALGYRARQAVPLNLAVSLVTIITSLLIRSRSLTVATLPPLLPVLLALIGGAMVSAFFGTSLLERLSERALEHAIQGLLLVIGLALLAEAMTTTTAGALLPAAIWIPAAVIFGLVIGMVSSLLGVAGGEVIIPTLIFAYGVDIKTAGTASLLVSLPTVLVGIGRHRRRGAYSSRDVLRTVAPMSAGSILGALIGGLAVGLISVSLLKALLGVVLIISAIRMFQHSTGSSPQP
jgi:uncharacterized membrane protein YfcA